MKVILFGPILLVAHGNRLRYVIDRSSDNAAGYMNFKAPLRGEMPQKWHPQGYGHIMVPAGR